MSFLDDIVDVGSGVWDWATGNSTSAGMARAAALAFMLKEVTDSINKDNDASKDKNKGKSTTNNADNVYSRETIDASTDNSIPVVYGSAFVGGTVTDAVLSADNQTMIYCLTLCEKTGTLMSTQQDSVITFKNIYWNEQELILGPDGIKSAKLIDADGVETTDIANLVEVYLFNNGSNSPTGLAGYSQFNTTAAYTIMPNWTTSHTMSELAFVIIKIKYSSTAKITSLPTFRFNIENSLKQPGDVLYDYMTNTRYGAGITATEIYDV